MSDLSTPGPPKPKEAASARSGGTATQEDGDPQGPPKGREASEAAVLGTLRCRIRNSHRRDAPDATGCRIYVGSSRIGHLTFVVPHQTRSNLPVLPPAAGEL